MQCKYSTSAYVNASRRASQEASCYLPAVRDIQATNVCNGESRHCHVFIFTVAIFTLTVAMSTVKPIVIFGATTQCYKYQSGTM